MYRLLFMGAALACSLLAVRLLSILFLMTIPDSIDMLLLCGSASTEREYDTILDQVMQLV